MRIRKRNLNSHETYACEVRDVKRVFGREDDVWISFGYGRNFDFAFHDNVRPRIDGIVIASAYLYDSAYRTNYTYGQSKLDIRNIGFYVIKASNYNAKNKEVFTTCYLPLMHQWYQEMLVRPKTSIFGVENFLVELSHDNFKVHRYSFVTF